jgi:hypothetical protein
MEEMISNMSIMKKTQFLIITHSRFNEMKSFYEHYKLRRYRNIIAGVDYEGFIKKYFKCDGVPYTVVFNKDNKIISAFTGQLSVIQLIDIVNQ